MSSRWSILFFAILSASCADAGLRREVAALRARVDTLEHERARSAAQPADATFEPRLTKVEKFLGPYMNQPPAPPEPDPAVTYAVPINGLALVGYSDAPVTMVFAFDYACPYSYRMQKTIKALQHHYGSQLRVVYEPFVVHPKTAMLPALAACAAVRQNRFLEMNELLWERGFAKGSYTRDLVVGLAVELKLDRARFETDLDSATCAQHVETTIAALQKLGTNGTPSTWVNGRFLGGAQPVERFEALIDEELAKANKRIAEGTPAAEYYHTYVLEKGATTVEPATAR